MSNRKPHNDNAGYVCSKRTGAIGADGKRGWVVVYRAAEAGLDESAGPWAVSCETHNTLLNVSSQRDARTVMKSGSGEFCDDCRATEAY